mmetsp:Transcript_2173/g.4943  ORF Transcript_2173/g.4943 Transcript_2173/m.4943 type:complete len:349 (-) Transcript_2173:133-1179(-)|eukprot:s5273_g4.t1
MDLEDELELSPRFVAALLRGGTGVGVLQRAHDELTRRAHNMWLETGRSDDKANWEDAERTLVRWRRQPETGSEGTPGLDALMCDSPMDAIDGGFAMDFAANREELAELCITLQANLHAAKAALQQEKCAVRALRKDLQAERARSKRFSFKLMAAEAQLYKETAAPCMQGQQGRPGTTTRGIPVLKALDGLKDAWQEAEHYSLTPRARVRRRLYSSPTQSSCSDCEACEISSPASGCHTPSASWWYADGKDSEVGDQFDAYADASLHPECSDSWWFSEDSTQGSASEESDAEGEDGAKGPGFAKGAGGANGAGYEYRFAFSPSPVTDNQGTQHLRFEPPKPYAFRRSRA